MSETINIRYTFTYNGETEVCDVALDATTLEHVFEPPATPPHWTELGCHQCKGCPLNVDDHPHCPMALSLYGAVESCKKILSFEEMDVRVDMPDRTIIKRTTAQKALSSLLGLHMAASGCPLMRLLRPMARFHTPFASRHETVFRAASTYLLAQYFLRHKGRDADLDLDGLQSAYAQIHSVNMGISRRLRYTAEGDANLNAVVLLDLLAQELPAAIGDRLQEIEYLFDAYM